MAIFCKSNSLAKDKNIDDQMLAKNILKVDAIKRANGCRHRIRMGDKKGHGDYLL